MKVTGKRIKLNFTKGIKDKWIAAMRSKRFKKVEGDLYKTQKVIKEGKMPEEAEYACCALGVLGCIHPETEVVNGIAYDKNGNMVSYDHFHDMFGEKDATEKVYRINDKAPKGKNTASKNFEDVIEQVVVNIKTEEERE